MGLLFVGGVMNLLWVVVIAFSVVMEKLIPWRRLTSGVAGGALILMGIAAFGGWVTSGSRHC